MSSVLSTAVEEFCSSASSLTGSLTAPLPEATAAISVFDSYCARSTELAWCTQLPRADNDKHVTNACRPRVKLWSSNSDRYAGPLINASPVRHSCPILDARSFHAHLFLHSDRFVRAQLFLQ